MARSTKAGRQIAAVFWLILIFAVFALLGGALNVLKSIGLPTIAGVVAASIGAYFIVQYRRRAEDAKEAERLKAQDAANRLARHEQLMEKYGDAQLVERIERSTIWQGQTEDQLRDSIGEPEEVDRAVLKTKRREIWKYQRLGANRFGLRVTVEDGRVAGYDQKSG